MLLRPLCLAILMSASLPLFPAQAWAETATQAAASETEVLALSDTLHIGPLFELMRDEGRQYSISLEEDMFPGRGGSRWVAQVDSIYDPQALRRQFDRSLVSVLKGDPAALAEMQAFFGSALGQKILGLEIEARRVLLDTAAEEAAAVAVEKLVAARDPRLQLVARLIETNDLIEMNVAGALGGNYAFYEGMSAEGIGAEISPDDRMAELWSQEDQIRSETEAWLTPYLVLAYKPLQDADIEAYIAFSASPAGQKLNGALFTAFDQVFRKVSYDLGQAAAKAILGNDI